MKAKAVLVLVDGLRPDAIELCGNSFLLEAQKEATSCFCANSVVPPITLPCHTSLFYSVEPRRHGITTNLWMPLVRPIDSLGDIVAKSGKKAAMFYNWEQLRDLNRPGSLHFSYFQSQCGILQRDMEMEREMTDNAVSYLRKEQPDFLFLYLGYTDEAGHDYGWMGKEYLTAAANASECIRKLKEQLPDGYHLIVTADHGGHERTHGMEIPEDMTIPMLFIGPKFAAGKTVSGVSLLDIAPTIADILEIECPREWEGNSLLAGRKEE